VLLSEADRELLYQTLARHAAAGRIDYEELERRVEKIHAAQTQDQAAAVMSDLPPLADASAEERRRWGRRHGEAERPAPGWTATSERFRDPASKKVMRVWVDPGGGRHYVADEDGAPPGAR
jgi:hypothetical protein